MTDGFEEHIGCEEWGERCNMRGTEQDEDSEGRIYRTYRVRRVCGRTGVEFVAVREESRHRKRVRIVTKFRGRRARYGGRQGRERRAWSEDSPDVEGRLGTESSPMVDSRQSVQDSSSIEKEGSHRVEREHDKENGRMEQRQKVRPDGDNAVVDMEDGGGYGARVCGFMM